MSQIGEAPLNIAIPFRRIKPPLRHKQFAPASSNSWKNEEEKKMVMDE